MRPIIKPPPPQIGTPSYDELTSLLGNAVGRFCSFCEKALASQRLLFHKQHGLLPADSKLTAQDWWDLLFICADCAGSINAFDPKNGVYFWPDTPDAKQFPYRYTKVDNITVTAQDPDGNPMTQTSISAVLVQISKDVPQALHAAAHNTYTLFRLNGRFFNDDFNKPAYTLPYAEYIRPSDIRLDQRWDVYLRAVDAAQALARAIPAIPVARAYVLNMLAMIQIETEGFGFLSTWVATITDTLDATDRKLLPQLLALMTGQSPPSTPINPTLVFSEMEDGIQQAQAVVANKRTELDQTLARVIAVQS